MSNSSHMTFSCATWPLPAGHMKATSVSQCHDDLISGHDNVISGLVNLKHMSQRNVADFPNATGLVEIDYAVDLRNFYESVEFDILELSAKRTLSSYMQPFPKVTFKILMRRKTLFYTVNLMMPCLVICFLSVLAFYLPSESGEKVYLSITILFSLTLFFLLLVETIPSTSLVIPLIGKYLLFTMILISLSIILTVYVLNVHFRSSLSHDMPDWVKRTFLSTLPRLLMIDRPKKESRPKPIKRFSKCVPKHVVSDFSLLFLFMHYIFLLIFNFLVFLKWRRQFHALLTNDDEWGWWMSLWVKYFWTSLPRHNQIAAVN